jgi:hypothetical protein
MTHPAVLFCQAATAHASAQSANMDGRLARSEPQFVQTMLLSREAIDRSHDLLARFQGGADPAAARPAVALSDIPVAILKSITGKFVGRKSDRLWRVKAIS